MTGRDLHYGWPEAAYLLFAVVFFACFYWVLHQYRKKALQSFAARPSLEKILLPRSLLFFAIATVAILGSWVAATLALMEPLAHARYRSTGNDQEDAEVRLIEGGHRSDEVLTQRRKAHEVVFILDASASMATVDTRLGISRLDYAKEIIDEVVSLLDGQMVALDSFTSELTPVVPVTLDYLFMRMMVRNVQINEGDVAGTDFLEMLEGVRKRYFTKNNEYKTIVILSDGGDTRLEAVAKDKRGPDEDAILNRVADASDYKVRIFTVGMGSRQGGTVPDVTFEDKPVHSALEDELLVKLADRGHGTYYFADGSSALAIGRDIADNLKQEASVVEEDADMLQGGKVERITDQRQDLIFDHLFQQPLAIAILLLSLSLLWPEVRRNRRPKGLTVLMLFMAHSPLTFAQGPSPAWNDAQMYFEAEQYDQARHIYQEILSGNLSNAQKTVALMNMATIEMAMQHWEQALQWLCQVQLGDDPDPNLLRRLKAYTAYALIHRSKASVQAAKEDEPSYKATLESAVHGLQNGVHSLAEAEEAERRLIAAHSIESGGDFADLLAMKRDAKDLLLDIRRRLDDYIVAHLSDKDRLSLLVIDLHSQVEDVESLGMEAMSESLRKRYMEEFVKHLKALKIHWDALRTSYSAAEGKEDLPDNSNLPLKKSLLHEAEQKSLVASDHFREGQLWKGRTSLAQSAEAIGLLHRVDGEKDPLQGALQDRVLLFEKIKMAQGNPDLLLSLGEEEGYIRALAASMAETAHAQLVEDKGTEDKQHVAEQMSLLQKRLSQGGVEKDATIDLLFYQFIPQHEADIVEGIYRNTSQPDLNTLFLQLYALKYKVDSRAKVTADGNIKALYQSASQLLNDALALEHAPDPSQSSKSLFAIMKRVLTLLDPTKVLKVDLEHLITDMSIMLKEQPPKVEAFATVPGRIQQLNDVAGVAKIRGMVPAVIDGITRDLLHASTSTQQGIAELQGGRNAVATLLLEDAQAWLQMAHGRLSERQDPKARLAFALVLQQWALHANETMQELEKGGVVNPAFKSAVISSQFRVLEAARPFMDDLKASLSKEASQGPSVEEQLAQSPLKEAVTAYHLGYRAAEQANNHLIAAPPGFAAAVPEQKEAVKQWTEALEKLKTPHDNDKDKQPPQPQDQQEEQQDQQDQPNQGNDNQQESSGDACEDLKKEQEQRQRQQEEQQEQDKQANEKLLDRLQQMEKDDEELNPQVPTKVRQGLRPW